MKNFGSLLVLAALCFSFFAGCGSSENFVFNQTSGTTAAVPDTPTLPGTGNIQIQMALQNNRSVKFEVRSFQVLLTQNGSTVFDQTFMRSDVGPSQTLEINGIEPGDYTLRILYRDVLNEVLGQYTQEITVVAGQNTVVASPNYRNTVLDFNTLRVYQAGKTPTSIQAADVNGDGTKDLITANNGSENVSLLLGNANGTFQPAVNYTVGVTPNAVRVANLNGDNILDIVTSNSGDDTVALLEGKGDGTFLDAVFIQIPRFLNVFRQIPFAAEVADVNGDNKLDIVVALSVAFVGEDRFLVFLQDGPAIFTEIPGKVAGLTVAEINGDENLDVITWSSINGALWIHEGLGDGSFQAPPLDISAQPGRSVVVLDLNDDERADIVYPKPLGDSVSVNLNNGNGTFQSTDFITGSNPVFVTNADFNGDQLQDIVTVNERGGTVSVLLGEGGGRFQAPRTFSAGFDPNSAVVLDVNGDDKLDIAITNFDQIMIALGNGDGNFATQEQLASASGSDPMNVMLVDINGDGNLDMVSTEGQLIILDGNDSIQVRLGTGDGTFGPPTVYRTGATALLTSLSAGDVNRDGKLDLVVSDSQNRLSVLLGNGDGTFQTATHHAVGSIPFSVTLGDVNGDGNPDLISANADSADLSVLLGNGDGTFQSATSVAVGQRPTSVKVGDVNRDNKLDLISANLSDSTLSVVMGNGDGTFRPATNFAVEQFPNVVQVADLNRDGNLDLVTGSVSNENLSVLLGNGDGSFGTPSVIPNIGAGFDRISPEWVNVADMNGDGILDLVSCKFFHETVTIFPGNGDGTFEDALEFLVGPGPYSVATGDLNGDENLDFVCSNVNSANVYSVILAR